MKLQPKGETHRGSVAPKHYSLFVAAPGGEDCAWCSSTATVLSLELLQQAEGLHCRV